MDRRSFFQNMLKLMAVVVGSKAPVLASTQKVTEEAQNKKYSMGISLSKCIGCSRCTEACRTENNVPQGHVRTWVERYVINKDHTVSVTDNEQSDNFTTDKLSEGNILRSFFVPKLCNQCENAPCVQVCPVGATFTTSDGVVLVDNDRCIGCGYCIQACPYSARYLHPVKKTADKCTFCYHRIRRGKLPACVEVCPTQARIFGEMNSYASPLNRFKRMNKINVLKPYLNTKPKVIYADLDGEVR